MPLLRSVVISQSFLGLIPSSRAASAHLTVTGLAPLVVAVALDFCSIESEAIFAKTKAEPCHQNANLERWSATPESLVRFSLLRFAKGRICFAKRFGSLGTSRPSLPGLVSDP